MFLLEIDRLNLLTQENIAILKQLESGFKRTAYWNKYLQSL